MGNKPTLREKADKELSNLYGINEHGKFFLSPDLRREIYNLFLNLLKEELEGLTVMGNEIIQEVDRCITDEDSLDEVPPERGIIIPYLVYQLSHTIKEIKERLE